MSRKMIALALAVAPFATAVPAGAQNAPQNGVLVIYGKDKCPTNVNGDEIVVCQRMDEQERFRIPKQLRELQVTPQNESWAMRQESALDAGGTGIGSCSTVGPGGGIGCTQNEIGAAKRESNTRRRAAAEIPPQ